MSGLQDFITEKVKLPSPPAVAIKILEAIRGEDSSFEDLATIVMTDPALTARILKVANSSLYGVKGEIDTLQKATAILGTNALRNIALSFVIIDNFKNLPLDDFDIEHFWRRAVTAAVAAEILSAQFQHKDSDLFISSLLQDIGVLLLFLGSPEKYSEMRDYKRVSKEQTHVAEKRFFSCDHAEAGSMLLESWNLPESIYLPVRYHHSPSAAETFQFSANILRLSGLMAAIFTGVHTSSKAIDIQQELVRNHDWSTDKIISVIDVVGDKAREMIRLFEIDPGQTMPLSHIMQDVIDELGKLNLSYEQVVLELQQAKNNAEQLALELKQANDSLRDLAYRDGLTGLYNHRYFQEMLQAELDRTNRYNNPLSLLFIDIDHFKLVNDTYGHLAGDQVLRSLSKKLTQLVRKCDLAARYGGEEFAIIMPETNLQSAKIIAQRVRRGIEQLEIAVTDKLISVTISIGLVCTDTLDDNLNRSAVIEICDQALYRAKEMGRNRVEEYS